MQPGVILEAASVFKVFYFFKDEVNNVGCKGLGLLSEGVCSSPSALNTLLH